ncbi:hypothetical protein PGH45_10095 [Legionella pneumophila]|uniref:hypothetical protein n=1 Tax=Legionella pneumophila TaxID=446 RepID=UPI0020C12FA1|nr:hypothetical protein [Legionella pneumophila]MDF1930338.1 hypothetical protein [Legionella pneumophila]
MNKIHIPLDIKSLEVISQCIDKEGNILFKVRSKKNQSICHKCGKLATKPNGRAPMRYDLIALGRPFIANPDLMNRIKWNADFLPYENRMLDTLF